MLCSPIPIYYALLWIEAACFCYFYTQLKNPTLPLPMQFPSFIKKEQNEAVSLN